MRRQAKPFALPVTTTGKPKESGAGLFFALVFSVVRRHVYKPARIEFAYRLINSVSIILQLCNDSILDFARQ
jgi:hypothetical protein